MMKMRSQKTGILMLGKNESSGERITVFFHRDILGAHRYTTRGGMCVLRRPLHGACPVYTGDRVLRNDRKRKP